MTIRVWNIETGTCLHTLQGHTSYVTSLVLSSDGKRLYSGSKDNTIRVWNTETGTCLEVYDPDANAPEDIRNQLKLLDKQVTKSDQVFTYARAGESIRSLAAATTTTTTSRAICLWRRSGLSYHLNVENCQLNDQTMISSTNLHLFQQMKAKLARWSN
jgi:WD40 repeat protein